jgi:hypothetical protein
MPDHSSLLGSMVRSQVDDIDCCTHADRRHAILDLSLPMGSTLASRLHFMWRQNTKHFRAGGDCYYLETYNQRCPIDCRLRSAGV